MSWDEDWLDRHITLYMEHELPRYEAYALFMESVLERVCDRLAPYALVQVRAKAPASFAEKCIRKHEIHPDPVFQMTDLCGARVITHFKQQVDAIAAFVREHFIIDEANSEDLGRRLRTGEFGYLSVHFVFQIPKRIDRTLDLTEKEKKWLKIIQGGDRVVPAWSRKAEIQIRTLAQHIWSDVFHDRIYKTPLKLPEQYKREASRLAALLESADDGLGELSQRIDDYKIDYGAYMSLDAIKSKMNMLKTILDTGLSKNQAALTLRLVKLAKAAGDWKTIVQATKGLLREGTPEANQLVMESGYALCKLHEQQRTHRDFLRGQRRLEQVAKPVEDVDAFIQAGHIESDETRAQALAHLAWSHLKANKRNRLRRARDLYYQATLYDPDNPYHFRQLLECEAKRTKDIEFLRLLRPQIEGAIEKCCEHADVGIELPFAHFAMAKLHLFAGRPYECLLEYTKGIARSNNEYAIDEELEASQELQKAVGKEFPDLEYVVRLLKTGRTAKLLQITQKAQKASEAKGTECKSIKEKLQKEGENDTPSAQEKELKHQLDQAERELEELQEEFNKAKKRSDAGLSKYQTETKDWLKDRKYQNSLKQEFSLGIRLPVLIVVGGTDPEMESHLEPYRKLLREALHNFEGTLFSGGTRCGVPGMLGEIAEEEDNPDRFQLWAYVPRSRPKDAPIDRRYDKVFLTEGTDFTHLELLQTWRDILAAGINPSEVNVLGINGGLLSRFEFHMALAMGAKLGLVEDTGREASKMLREDPWWEPTQLLRLPQDPMAICAFLFTTQSGWKQKELEPAAKKVHERFLKQRKDEPPEAKPWKDLPEDFKKSCFHQVLCAKHILQVAGMDVEDMGTGWKEGDAKLLNLSDPKVLPREMHDKIAAMEHGRWIVERLMQGWRYGPVKDAENKISPYLIPWEELDFHIREYDLKAVLDFPKILKESNLQVVKRKRKRSK